MAVSHTRTAATLSVLGVLLVIMVVYGWQQATAAFPGSSDTSATAAPTCQNPQTTTSISTKEVTVSIYNASTRKGLADRTMSKLEARGFKAGAIGNAPSGTDVDYIEVRAGSVTDPEANLVAEQFKPKATVVAAEDDLGPGVDVFMGRTSHRPMPDGPSTLKLTKPVVTCLDKPTRSPAS